MFIIFLQVDNGELVIGLIGVSSSVSLSFSVPVKFPGIEGRRWDSCCQRPLS